MRLSMSQFMTGFGRLASLSPANVWDDALILRWQSWTTECDPVPQRLMQHSNCPDNYVCCLSFLSLRSMWFTHSQFTLRLVRLCIILGKLLTALSCWEPKLLTCQRLLSWFQQCEILREIPSVQSSWPAALHLHRPTGRPTESELSGWVQEGRLERLP